MLISEAKPPNTYRNKDIEINSIFMDIIKRKTNDQKEKINEIVDEIVFVLIEFYCFPDC